jgi:hypothetical protein
VVFAKKFLGFNFMTSLADMSGVNNKYSYNKEYVDRLVETHGSNFEYGFVNNSSQHYTASRMRWVACGKCYDFFANRNDLSTKDAPMEHYSWVEHDVMEYNEIADWLERKGVLPIFVIFPGANINMYGARIIFDELREQGHSVIDLRDEKDFPELYDVLQLSDYAHLNKNGAKKLSEKFYQKVQEHVTEQATKKY